MHLDDLPPNADGFDCDVCLRSFSTGPVFHCEASNTDVCIPCAEVFLGRVGIPRDPVTSKGTRSSVPQLQTSVERVPPVRKRTRTVSSAGPTTIVARSPMRIEAVRAASGERGHRATTTTATFPVGEAAVDDIARSNGAVAFSWCLDPTMALQHGCVCAFSSLRSRTKAVSIFFDTDTTVTCEVAPVRNRRKNTTTAAAAALKGPAQWMFSQPTACRSPAVEEAKLLNAATWQEQELEDQRITSWVTDFLRLGNGQRLIASLVIQAEQADGGHGDAAAFSNDQILELGAFFSPPLVVRPTAGSGGAPPLTDALGRGLVVLSCVVAPTKGSAADRDAVAATGKAPSDCPIARRVTLSNGHTYVL